LSTSSSEFERGGVARSLLSDADRQAVAEIAVTLRAATHGCIYFAVCNNRLKVEAAEAVLAQALSPHGIDQQRIVLAEREAGAEAPTYRPLIPNLFDRFQQTPPVASRLYIFQGLPELIRAETGGDDSKVAPVSQLLNFRREFFRDQSVRALFWLDPETVPYIMQNAPDFWSFRSGMARFTDTFGAEAMQPRDSGAWQQSEASQRFAGDLDEKLQQLASYRKKSPPDENAIANLLLDLGQLYLRRYDLQNAFDALHEAEGTFERLKLPFGISAVKTVLARAFRQTGQLDHAEESIRQAIRIDEELQSEAGLATDYGGLSRVYQARGELQEAEHWLRKAIDIAERQGNEAKLAVLCNNLSQIYHGRGELKEAEEWLRRAIAIDERREDESQLAICYSNLSKIYQERGQWEEAEKRLREAIAIDERLGDEPNLAIDYNNLSQIYQDRGESQEAENWLLKAIAIVKGLGDEPKLAVVYNNLSQIYKARGQLREAEEWLRKAIAIDERLGDEPKLAIRYNNLSLIYQGRGQWEEAEQWLRKALALMEPKGRSATLETLRSNLAALERQESRQPRPPSP
jgi:tetratricopeptide (TPR) repeat protein